jgi:cell division protein FtsN
MQGSNAAAGRTLNRDFKDVRKHTAGGSGTGFSGWTGFAAGLGLGLAVALGVHLYDRQAAKATAEPAPAAQSVPKSAAATEEPATGGGPAENGAVSPDPPAQDFDFYKVLPEQQVDVPAGPPPKDKPTTNSPLPKGDVVLQAGSFKQYEQAEKLQAKLALAGIESKVSKFPADDETWYRVRIGPIATVEQLQSIETKLREAEVEATPVTGSNVDLPPP